MAVATEPLRVLYVEDDRVTALLFAQALSGEPRIALRMAEDGEEALALVAGWLPDVLVLDAHLPGGLTGHQLLARLRSLPGLDRAPAFMCSADNLPEDFARARAAGFDGYWTKPLPAGLALNALLALDHHRS